MLSCLCMIFFSLTDAHKDEIWLKDEYIASNTITIVLKQTDNMFSKNMHILNDVVRTLFSY